MFGLRIAGKTERADVTDGGKAPYSRFTSEVSERKRPDSEYTRFQPTTVPTRRRPVAVPVQTIPEPMFSAPAGDAHDPDLYSERAVPTGVLHNALPRRFKSMKLHGIRDRSFHSDDDFDDLFFAAD